MKVDCGAEGRQVPSESSRTEWNHRGELIPTEKTGETLKPIATQSVSVSLSLKRQEVNKWK